MDNNLMKLEKLIEKLDRIDGIEFPISDQELCERYENLYTGAVNDVLREATLMDQALPITILPLQFEMRAEASHSLFAVIRTPLSRGKWISGHRCWMICRKIVVWYGTQVMKMKRLIGER